jgi:hypothetical protein
MAARNVVREVRDYLPVEGESWAFEGARWLVPHQDAVCFALLRFEEWVNPARLPYDDPKRGVPEAVAGLPEGRLEVAPRLRAITCAVVNWHNRVLAHYQLESIAEQRDPAYLSWPWGIEPIDKALLEGLEKSADLLLGCLEGDFYQRLLGCHSEPENSSGREAAAAERPLLSSPARPGQEEAGHLGLVLDEGRREVHRRGHEGFISLARSDQLWKVMRLLVGQGGRYTEKGAIANATWKNADPHGRRADVDRCISRLREHLKPLGVTVEVAKGVGVILAERRGGPQHQGRTAKEASPRAGRPGTGASRR